MPQTNGKRKQQQEAFERFFKMASSVKGPEQPIRTPPAPGSRPPIPPPLPIDSSDPGASDSDPESNDEGTYSIRRLPRPREDGAPPPKRIRGLVKGLKAYDHWRVHGEKVKIIFDSEFLHGPNTRGKNSWLTHDVGHIVRDIISMTKPSWWEHEDEEREKLLDELKLYYDIDWNDKKMVKWIHDHAASIYCKWKSWIKTNRNKETPDVIPKEFKHRKEEWKWMLGHFESPEFKKRSEANTKNRGEKKLHHTTGPTPFIYGALELKKKGEPMALLKNYELVYPADHPEAIKNIQKIRQEVDRVTAKVRDEFEVPDDQIVHYFDEPTQVEVFINALGPRNKNEVRGVGRATFGVTSQSSNSSTACGQSSTSTNAIVQEALSRAARLEEEGRETKERLTRAEQEAREAKEDAQKAKEKNLEAMERIKRLEEMWTASNPSQPITNSLSGGGS